MSRPILTAATCALCACGRVGFDPAVLGDDQPGVIDAPPGAIDGAPATVDAAVPPCDLDAPFGTLVPLAGLDLPAIQDGTLRLMPDERHGFFWSRRSGSAEVYAADRATLDDDFTVTVPAGIGGASEDLDPSISADGLTLVFRSSRSGDSDIWRASRATSTADFDAPVAIDAVNTAAEQRQPFLSTADGALYYVAANGGDDDVFRAAWDGATTFGPGARVPELDAMGFDDGDPTLSFDGLEIYWRSDRAGGAGGFDVWHARRPSLAEPFADVALVTELGSALDDGPSTLSPDGCRIYVSSTRDGSNDVFVATRPPT